MTQELDLNFADSDKYRILLMELEELLTKFPEKQFHMNFTDNHELLEFFYYEAKNMDKWMDELRNLVFKGGI